MKLCSEDLHEPINDLVDQCTSSMNFNRQLAVLEIFASLAHVKILGKSGLLGAAEVDKIITGLHNILLAIKDNAINYKVTDGDGDIDIEKLLQAEIGDLAR